ncbi:translin-associated protein X [Pleurodeles waltl]|uniref:translin-associated protein X n=1 Tax=Pleurodeles waltl TaxID=8319 RepID=UPI003709708A
MERMAGHEAGGFRKRKHDNFPHSQRREDKDINVNCSSSVMLAFNSFQHDLDARHDKYERLVKLGRDITIESKRTIFLLHRVISTTNKEELLAESESKLNGVRHKIKQVAQELMGEDMYQYHRAFTPGLQEYVEAVTFQHFIKTQSLISIEDINKELVFAAKEEELDSKNGKTIAIIVPSEFPEKSTSESLERPVFESSLCSSSLNKLTSELSDTQLPPSVWSLQVTPVDYLLGVADLTGELMRLCIGSVGNGDIDTPFELSQFLREIHDGFSYIGNTGPYEISRKLYTLKQSLAKVENACYTLKVRGSEIPKHMLADVFSTKADMTALEDNMS